MNTDHMNTTIEGIGSISGGKYGRIDIEGVGSINGDLEFEVLSIEGTCKCSGNLKGGTMDVQGGMTCKKDIRVRRLDIEGVVKSDGIRVYADEIYVEGVLNNKGEVNADKVRIEGCASLNDLFGDDIRINYGHGQHIFHGLFGFRPEKRNTARNIECSQLTACNMSCHSISATEIHLSSHCRVDHITCDGKLVYDSTCRIGSIDGDCEKIVK